MNGKTIVFVTNNYTPYSGGVVSSIKAFAQSLRASGHNVYIITLDFKDAPREEGVIRLYCPLKFTYKNNPMAVPWKTGQALGLLVHKLSPDIVHTHHPFLLGSAAQKVCKKLNIPVFFTHHTQYDQYLHYIPLPKGVMKPVVNKWVERYCKMVDHVIAPSCTIKDMLLDRNIKTPISVVPSPILPVFSQAMPKFIPKKSSDVFRLLFVGRFSEEKNIEVLIDMVSELDERFILQLVGYGYHEQVLKEYVSKKAPKNCVQFIHKPSKKQLSMFYRNAALFVFSSRTETQGIVLAEAMACGTPVVAFNGPGQYDIVKNGINGFLVETIEQMRDAVIKIHKDPLLFENLQHGAWKTGRNYAMDVVIQRLLSCYTLAF